MSRGDGCGSSKVPVEPNYCEDCEHHQFVGRVGGGEGGRPDYHKHVCTVSVTEGPGGIMRVFDGIVDHNSKHVLECWRAKSGMNNGTTEGCCPKFSAVKVTK